MHILLFLLFFSSLFTEAYFIPPKEWNIADPSKLSPRVHISFLTKGKKEYCPSLNMASEKIALNLDEYLRAVKEVHSKDPNSKWRDLGKFISHAGEGRLTEIESKTPLGTARLLQFIFIKNGTAYVLTASALKEEFASHMKNFQKAFESFSIVDDLFEAIEKKPLREKLKKEFDELLAAWQKRKSSLESHANKLDEEFQKRYFLPFQNKVIEECAEMGGYWQVLMLQFVQNKLS